MKNRFRIAAVLGAGVLLVSGGAAVADAATGQPITGGRTTVDLAGATMTALHGAGLKLSAVAPATLNTGVLGLPIRGGTANPPNFVIDQAGGFTVVKGSKVVRFSHLVLNTKTSRATADVTNHGNIVTLILGQPNSGSGGPGFVQYGGFSVTFAPAAVKVLDTAFGTGVFARHPKLGTGSVTVRF